MAEQARLSVAVITPQETVFEDTADMVVFPAWDGEVGILKGHAPMMALLGSGELRVTRDGTTQSFQVSGGFMQVADDVVSIMSETAERA